MVIFFFPLCWYAALSAPLLSWTFRLLRLKVTASAAPPALVWTALVVVTNKQTHAATNKKLQVCLNIVGVKNNVRVIKKKEKFSTSFLWWSTTSVWSDVRVVSPITRNVLCFLLHNHVIYGHGHDRGLVWFKFNVLLLVYSQLSLSFSSPIFLPVSKVGGEIY